MSNVKKNILFIVLTMNLISCVGNNSSINTLGNSTQTASIMAGSTTAECSTPRYDHYYAYNTMSNDLSAYAIDKGGELISISLNIPEIHTGIRPAGIAASADGNYIYVAGQMDNTISVYSHNCLDNSLTKIQVIAESFGVYPFTVTLSPDGKYLYVPNYTTNDISMFTINETTGKLTPLSTAYAPNGTVTTNGIGTMAGGGALPLKFENTGKYAYAGNYGSNTVSLFKYNNITGDLIYIQTFSSNGVGPRRIMSDNNGHLYVLNELSNNISAYNINPTDGSLSLINVFSTGINPIYMFITGTGKFLYVSNAGENTLSQYKILSDGNLNNIGTVNTGMNPRDFYICQDRYLYVGVANENRLNMFAINDIDGKLSAMSTFSISAGMSPSGGVCI